MSNFNVQNAMFDSTATQQGLTKAADRIVKAITDGDKTSQKIIETIKTGTEKIVDSIGKTRTTNNASQPDSVTAIHRGLKSVAVGTAQIAEHVRKNPSEIPAALESAQAVNRQFTDLVDTASQFAQCADTLQAVTQETVKAGHWIGGQYCGNGGAVANNRVVHSFGELFTG